MKHSFSAILLAGGIGTRMQSSIPKQYLHLRDKPIVLHSFETLLACPALKQIVVVCESVYYPLFQAEKNHKVIFAQPGIRRQDSVFNGFNQLSLDHLPQHLICIHDAARPLLQLSHLQDVLSAAAIHGAAALGVPVKNTIKVCDASQKVQQTLDRSKLWEIQTPQVIQHSLLKEGLQKVHKHHVTVTDDVALVELIHKDVKIVQGCYTNLKITTPEDLILANYFLEQACIAIK
jgi:2-C-methyl-D-erythritol 4-phosphate cytidylyltransferase